eukprot:TRINITY_DN6419_c0_g1_i1.p2 TRINITY_DN6419_c0_g1~~TRINITY_DN6419_c0_g1_i1.p2  ORF type:complete len:358 (+),score=95.54 TRINITY_DN6419_c0_g1_i1:208-1281(+)
MQVIQTQQTDADRFYEQFGVSSEPGKTALLYSDRYNISFFGLEKLHPFDSCKYKNIMRHLIERNFISAGDVICPQHMPSRAVLKTVHSDEYLDSLCRSSTVARITELFFVAMLPNALVRWRVLEPFLYATSGSILAGKVAIEKGWAINLGGGFHHCSGSEGGGFCAYADITLCYQLLRQNFPQRVRRVLIVDLDAHQGNGHARDKLANHDDDVFIVDMFNASIYPQDRPAERAINIPVRLRSGCRDSTYLSRLRDALIELDALQLAPDVLIYNAGTDILDGDPLGRLNISPEGVIARDEIVFGHAVERRLPIVMLLSGGYQKTNADVIARSIENLDAKFGIIHPRTHDAPQLVDGQT